MPDYAIGEHDGTHFYAMELIDGPSLDHVIRHMRQANPSGGRQPPESALRGLTPPAQNTHAPKLLQTGPYIANADTSTTTAGLTSSSLGSGSGYFDALDYAHKEGVIHRNNKWDCLESVGRMRDNGKGRTLPTYFRSSALFEMATWKIDKSVVRVASFSLRLPL